MKRDLKALTSRLSSKRTVTPSSSRITPGVAQHPPVICRGRIGNRNAPGGLLPLLALPGHGARAACNMPAARGDIRDGHTSQPPSARTRGSLTAPLSCQRTSLPQADAPRPHIRCEVLVLLVRLLRVIGMDLAALGARDTSRIS